MKSVAVHSRTIIGIFFGLVFSAVVVYAVPPGSPYSVGETLDPACAPGDSNCSVTLVSTQQSITSDGSGLKLSGDTASPGNNYVYGTNGIGARAWVSQSALVVPISSLANATGTGSTVNAGNQLNWSWNSLGAATGLNLTSSSTAPASNSFQLMNIGLTGTNANANQTTVGLNIDNQKLGTGANNVALRLVAGNGGGGNYALLSNGKAVFGDATTPSSAPSALVSVGTLGTQGTLAINNASFGRGVTIGVPNTNFTNWNLTLPDTAGGLGQTWVSDGSGTMSWVSLPTNITPGGSDTEIQFNNSGEFGASSNFIFNSGTSALTLTGAETINGGVGTGLTVNSESVRAIAVAGNGGGVSLGTGLQSNGEMGLSESGGDTVIASYTTADVKFNGDPSYIYANRAFMVNTSTKIGYLGDPVGIGTVIESFEISNGVTNCAIVVVSGALSCTSDERLKTNIVDLSSALDQLATLRTVTFNWKNNPTSNPQIGFLAQDLRKHFPTLVSTDSKGYLQANYAGMTPILTKAIQELDIKVRAIETVDQNSAFVAGLSAWLANASNRITRIFTGEICLTDTDGSSECLTKAELGKLKALLDAQ